MKAEITVKENYEFRRIYRKGKSIVTPYLVLYCQRNRQGRTRLGVTVSTKLGKAVVRNRVRRRLREIYRLNEDKFFTRAPQREIPVGERNRESVKGITLIADSVKGDE